MTDKIAVGKPLVVLHGDEMAQIAFDRILEQFVNKYLDIPLIEIDLSAENRVLSNAFPRRRDGGRSLVCRVRRAVAPGAGGKHGRDPAGRIARVSRRAL